MNKVFFSLLVLISIVLIGCGDENGTGNNAETLADSQVVAQTTPSVDESIKSLPPIPALPNE